MWMQYVCPSMEKKSVCEPMCCLSWSIPFPLNHGPVCGTDYHMTTKVPGCRLYPEFQRKCILYHITYVYHIIFIPHTKLQLIIHFPSNKFPRKKMINKKGIQFTSFQGHFCRYDFRYFQYLTWIRKSSQSLGKWWHPSDGTPFHQPHIHLVYWVFIGYNSFKRASWGVKQLGALHPKGPPVFSLWHRSWICTTSTVG